MKASVEGICASLSEKTAVLNLEFTVPMYKPHISSKSEKKAFCFKEKKINVTFYRLEQLVVLRHLDLMGQ